MLNAFECIAGLLFRLICLESCDQSQNGISRCLPTNVEAGPAWMSAVVEGFHISMCHDPQELSSDVLGFCELRSTWNYSEHPGSATRQLSCLGNAGKDAHDHLPCSSVTQLHSQICCKPIPVKKRIGTKQPCMAKSTLNCHSRNPCRSRDP